MKVTQRIFVGLMAVVLVTPWVGADSLQENFVRPPDSARPWVYWFWNNGAVSREGITADLEAMKRVGVGGVIIMDVVERFAPPAGTAKFMGAEWRGDLQFAVTEAARLGLEINMTNGPGWCGSSGPWITPELSMQHLVMAQTSVDGPRHFSAPLPQADVSDKKDRDHFNSFVPTGGFYRDVAVLAFPQSDNGIIPRQSIVDLSAKMDVSGKLSWEVPSGRWIVQRFGHASTGSSTRPPVLGGNGLECDKLSEAAMDVHFAAMMGKLLDTAGPLAGKSLVATHIDSWEVGSQDWTETFADEFKKRRGYNPIRYLVELKISDSKAATQPVSTNWEIDSKEMGDRFRWDFYQTISELMAQNYTGRIAELAHARGLRFTLEGYNLPFADEALYTAAADEPMTEFWTPNPDSSREGAAKARQMASVAHIYGRPIVGAESFTSGDQEEWKYTPATIKALGDFEMSQGVNRFVIHRYAHQPWLNRAPGATMGPWGLHYERTNTWWEMSGAWHEYLARCQWMLRQGHYVADLLYLRPQYPNQTYFTPVPAPPAGYRYDEISAEGLIERVSVKDGRLVLPDGMSYRILVMPTQTRVITPALAKKIEELVKAGAVVYGRSPTHAPGLSDYPKCDDVVADVAKEVWGNTDGAAATEHQFGSGEVFNGEAIGDVLGRLKIDPDFTASVPINWIHRHLEDAEVYFVANPTDAVATADCKFRVAGMTGELWDPQTGKFLALDSNYRLQLGPSESDFVVFRKSGSAHLMQAIKATKPLMDLSEKWDVTFPPHWGAPASAGFDKLISWSDSPDQGIRYFSGTATYRKQFDIEKPSGRSVLDLGDVHVMAHVKLNGQNLGILWKRPYRVEITNALKVGKNELEVQVVNLWPNRMIGDAGLPVEKRFTWSSWEPFNKDTPLLPSGLIGPVGIWVEP